MSALTAERALSLGRKTVRDCPLCTERERELRTAAQKLKRKAIAIREREQATCYGACAALVWGPEWKWFKYWRRALHASVLPVCHHQRRVVSFNAARAHYHEPEPADLGALGYEAGMQATRDSALSDLIDLQDDAFAWRPLAYSLTEDLTELEETGSAFEKVADAAAADRVDIELLDDEDWRRVYRHHEGEARFYVEVEDRYAPMHFLDKWIQGEDPDDPRDHFGRDHLAALRRRHQSAQLVADLLERKRRHFMGHLPFDQWIEQWCPDVVAEGERQFNPPVSEREPLWRYMHPSLKPGVPKRAIARIHVDALSELELAIVKRHLREQYQARFGEQPDEVYVNLNWSAERVAAGELADAVVAAELPDELLYVPDEVLEEEPA